MPIVLKDQNSSDVTFSFARVQGNVATFVATADDLNSRRVLQLSINEGAATNRVKFKLTVPKTCQTDTGCVSKVEYNLVASGDFSIVRASSEDAREEIVALISSLMGSNQWAQMVEDGVMPA